MGALGLVLGIGLPLLLIGGPIGFAYGFCYDGSNVEFVADPNFNQDEVLTNILANSLKSTRNDYKIHLGVSEYNVNNLLNNAFSELDPTLRKYVKSPYIKVNEKENSVEFILKAEVPLFKTSVNISTSFSFVHADDNHPEGVLFRINEIKIGRLKALSLGTSIASALISDESITKLLKDAGVNMQVSLKDKTLFYKSEDLINDVIKKAGVDNIYLSMVEFGMENNLLSTSYSKSSLGINLELEKFMTNTEFIDESKTCDIASDMMANLTNTALLLNQGDITLAQVDQTLDFLRLGYEKSSVEIQNFVKTVPFSKIGIPEVETYKGFNIVSTGDITKVFNKQIESFDPIKVLNDKKLDIVFDEDDLNETLKTSNIICQSYQFVGKIDNQYVVNSIFIDEFNVNIMNNEFDFVIGVNFNGCPTKLIIRTAVNNSEGNIIKLDITDILFGEIAANEEIKQTCIGFIMDALTNLTSWFRADGEGKLIFFDLNECVNQISNETIKTFISNCTLTSQVTGTKLYDKGSLKITFSK